MEKISIIIPIYNQERFLHKCLDSIAAQTYPEFEVLLVDDGSTDASGKICRDFEERDPRFKYIVQKNLGVAAARNTGLDHVSGDLIGFIDPDDWVEPDFYERLIALYHQYGADIISCGRQEAYDESVQIEKEAAYEVLQCDTAQALAFLAENQKVKSHLWNRIYRPALFEKLRFENGRVYEDVWILHQVFARAKRFVFTEEPLYYYRQHPASIVRTVTISKQLDHCYAHQCRYQFLAEHYPELRQDLIRNYSYEITGLVDAAVAASWKDVRLNQKEIENAVTAYCKLQGADLTDPKVRRISKNVDTTILYYKLRRYIKR